MNCIAIQNVFVERLKVRDPSDSNLMSVVNVLSSNVVMISNTGKVFDKMFLAF